MPPKKPNWKSYGKGYNNNGNKGSKQNFPQRPGKRTKTNIDDNDDYGEDASRDPSLITVTHDQIKQRVLHRSPKISNPQKDADCPYHHWSHFFPEDIYNNEHPAYNYIELFVAFFKRTSMRDWDLELMGKKKALILEFAEIVRDCENPNFPVDLHNSPAVVLSSMSIAASHIFCQLRLDRISMLEPKCPDDQIYKDSCKAIAEATIITVRILNYEPIVSLRDLKARYIEKFVGCVGTVTRVSLIRAVITKMEFICSQCQTKQVVSFPDGKLEQPTSCTGYQCKSKTFVPDRSSKECHERDYQKIRIQEQSDDINSEAGRIPRIIDCEAYDDLVDLVTPGDLVHFSGIVNVAPIEDGKIRKDSGSLYSLYVTVNSICTNKIISSLSERNSNEAYTPFSKKDHVFLNESDVRIIRDIAKDESNIFKLLVNSLCPTIFGHELVKAGLLLALFGGSIRVDSRKRLTIRSNPHVMIVGDPGLGKSQMLRACNNVAPLGVYVCANTTSSAGLTVALTREAGTGEMALEAGALVLADEGCCCIDEFDKIEDPHSLLEAMEQQSVSIAKAGVIANLPARASILSAANPKLGHYDMSKSVSDNLRMNTALLSRFDLIFVLRDRPNEELDRHRSAHVIAMQIGDGRKHPNAGPSKQQVPRYFSTQESKIKRRDDSFDGDDFDDASNAPLSERLRIGADDELELIPSTMLRKYLAYARKYINPRLSQEALAVIRQYYLQWRKSTPAYSELSTPVTTRQLESIIRLSEARARLSLRTEVLPQDAIEVIEIMKSCLEDVVPRDNIAKRRGGYSGSSKKSEAKRFISELKRVSDSTGQQEFTNQDLYQVATEMRIQMTSFQDLIDSLNLQGFLLKKGNQRYKLSLFSC